MNKTLMHKVFRDVILVNLLVHKDWQAAGRLYAGTLGASFPYNVVCGVPTDDFTKFGATLSDEDRRLFATQGAILLRPQTRGNA